MRLTPEQYAKLKTTGGSHMRALMLAKCNVRILIAAMTFFALLVVLLASDGCLGTGLLDSGWLPAPLPE